MPESKGPNSPRKQVDFYDAIYRRFDQTIYHEIRRETWGEDIGQNGWLTAPEQDRFIQWLSIGPNRRLLDIACGSGGPTLRIARQTGANVVGVDLHADGIVNARAQAESRGLGDKASFDVVNAAQPLPFAAESFDAIICIDAINHLPERARVLADWARVLKPGGHLVFTDTVVVTGPLTIDEIAVRSSIGFFLFVAPDTNDRCLTDAGLRLANKEDVSDALARTATSWREARDRRADQLRQIEGAETFAGQQLFFEVAARIARERRLSRFVYHAVKPTAKPTGKPSS